MITAEKRKTIVTDIINYFECDRNEKMGVVAAEELLDFMLQNFGPDLYNKGVEDSLALIKERFHNLEIDMGAILKK